MTAVCLPRCEKKSRLVAAAKRDGYHGDGGGWIAHESDGDPICQGWDAFAILFTLNGGAVVPRFGTKRVAGGVRVTDASGAQIGFGGTRARALENALKALYAADKAREACDVPHPEVMASSARIVPVNSPGLSDARPWLVYVDKVMLRSRSGVGRRFKTGDAALLAGSAYLAKMERPT